MDEILNNLEEISNLLAENKNFSLKDFSPISKLIAKTQNQVIRLCEVNRSLPKKQKLTLNNKDKKFIEQIADDYNMQEETVIEIFKKGFKKAQEPSDNG